jgi:hypothetical protein
MCNRYREKHERVEEEEDGEEKGPSDTESDLNRFNKYIIEKYIRIRELRV